MTHRPQHREAGFTLLEMIVAMAILGLVLGLLGGAAKLLRGTGDRIGEAAAALGDLALLNGLLQEQLGDAVALEVGPAGRRVSAFDGRPEAARFLTLAPDFVPGEPLIAMAIGTAAIGTAAAGTAPSGGVELRRAEVSADAPDLAALDLPDRAEIRRLAPDVRALEFGYFGRKDGADSAAWHSTWQAQRRLPAAVRLVLDHARLDLAPVIVPIRQSLAALCAIPEPGPECDGG